MKQKINFESCCICAEGPLRQAVFRYAYIKRLLVLLWTTAVVHSTSKNTHTRTLHKHKPIQTT